MYTFKAAFWVLVIVSVMFAAPILGALFAVGGIIYILRILFKMEAEDENV
jgi:hypothetical protein